MKRRLLIIVVFLLLGAVVNGVVAWGCLTWSLTERGIFSRALRYDERWWRRHAPSGFEGTAAQVCRLQGFGLTGITRGAHETHYENHGGTLAVVPYWIIAQEVRAGWPARTMSGQRWTRGRALMGPPVDETKTVYRWSRSLGPAIRSSDDVRSWRLLPLGPLWLGFLINSVFYGALLALLICGPFALRRFLRVRRGLCPKCAYPMGDSSRCTECGGVLAKRAVA